MYIIGGAKKNRFGEGFESLSQITKLGFFKWSSLQHMLTPYKWRLEYSSAYCYVEINNYKIPFP